MGRRSTLAFALSLVLAACTTSDSTSDTSTTAPSTTKAATNTPGRLVILDGSANIVVLDPDGSNESALTDDAGENAGYTQPIWSPDGLAVAWGEVTQTGFAVGIQHLIDDEPIAILTGNLPFYMSWSPGSDRIGVLQNGAKGIDFHLVDVAKSTIKRVGSGSPYYFSWSPVDDRLVTHVGADRVQTIDFDGASTDRKPTGPFYLAPQWTEAGVFHVVADTLVLEADDGVRNPVATFSGLTMFVSNPEGTRVALQVTGEGGAIEVALTDPPTVFSRTVSVLDLESGDVEVVSDSIALGFFWSPDGDSLLALVPDAAAGTVVPHVWSDGGGVDRYPGYRPPNTMLQDTFPFFPQYAQSINFWAPDSSAFTYAGQVGSEEGIWVQRLVDDAPQKVSDGRWVVWSSSAG